MPNWCENRLKVSGPEQVVRAFDQAFKGRPALWPPEDFELKDKRREEVEAKQKEAWEALEPSYCFNALYPVPLEVLRIGYSVADRSEKDGYHWCNNNWGIKWDVYGNVIASDPVQGLAEYDFDTAWSPPVEWLKKVARDWPSLTFRLSFIEEAAGYAGYVIFADGQKQVEF